MVFSLFTFITESRFNPFEEILCKSNFGGYGTETIGVMNQKYYSKKLQSLKIIICEELVYLIIFHCTFSLASP